MTDPVAITGLGVVSPLGADAASTWRGLLDGRQAVRQVRLALPGGGEWEVYGASVVHPARVHPPVEDRRDVEAASDPRSLRSRVHAGSVLYGIDRLTRWAIAAATEAVGDRDLSVVEPHRIGVVVGTSKGVPDLWADGTRPFFPDRSPDAAAVAVARQFRVAGPVLCPVAACSTGLLAVLRGADLIRHGDCDLVLAGAADASLHPLVLASFDRMGVLARTAEPATVCRPFDRDRSGFAVGEGAAVFLLERGGSGGGANGPRLAAVAGGAVAGDAAGLTDVDPTGRTAAHALRAAVGRAGLTAADITLLGLHGTGTVPNDPAECRAVRSALGPAADDTAAFGIKGAVGHLLGAAGAVELAATLLALRDRTAPPTANLRNRDPACDLPLVDRARPVRPGAAAKLSLGFGGTIAACVLVP